MTTTPESSFHLEKKAIIIQLFKEGLTTGELGKQFYMSRQGIYNILKQAGLSGKDGGRTIKSGTSSKVKKEIQRIDKLNASCKQRYGCSYAEWKALRNMHAESKFTPIAAYSHNRSYAERVKIKWNVSLPEWWCAWEISGQWNNRGRRDEEYCLVRIDESRGYEADNIHVIQNHQHWANVMTKRWKKPASK
jgi:hypothetical protein